MYVCKWDKNFFPNKYSKCCTSCLWYLKILSRSRRLEPLVEIENWGYKGRTTSLVIPSFLICTLQPEIVKWGPMVPMWGTMHQPPECAKILVLPITIVIIAPVFPISQLLQVELSPRFLPTNGSSLRRIRWFDSLYLRNSLFCEWMPVSHPHIYIGRRVLALQCILKSRSLIYISRHHQSIRRNQQRNPHRQLHTSEPERPLYWESQNYPRRCGKSTKPRY